MTILFTTTHLWHIRFKLNDSQHVYENVMKFWLIHCLHLAGLGIRNRIDAEIALLGQCKMQENIQGVFYPKREHLPQLHEALVLTQPTLLALNMEEILWHCQSTKAKIERISLLRGLF